MKKYLLFPTYTSSWSLDPQYVLCGSPRIVILEPISNASTFLWEQIEPNPSLFPVSIIPNNTSKNVSIVIPNDISNNILLRVTLNGDTTNYKYVEVIPLLVDKLYNFNKGQGLMTFSNTLNDPISLITAPYLPLGSQAILYTNNTQLTGVRFKGQDYRNGFLESIEVSKNSVFIDNISINRDLYNFSYEPRLNININTDYEFLKKWKDIKVISQEVNLLKQKVQLIYPTIIADEFSSSFSKGEALISFERIPYLFQNVPNIDNITNNFSKGQALISFERIPFLVDNYYLQDNITNNFNKGQALMSFERIPYTSTIIG
jgi:hypothetical protein